MEHETTNEGGQDVSHTKKGTGNNFGIIAAIILAGGLIAGALYFSNNSSGSLTPPVNNDGAPEVSSGKVPPVTENDHILGNPNAQVVIVEYSDFECPFCKDFHTTMHKIIDEYGAGGRVAWVFRHFPLAQLHSKAPKEAEASECAGELGGNDGFWKFADRLFATTPSNNLYNLDNLPKLAEEVGLDRNAFEECLESGRYADKIDKQFNEAIVAGANGTPFNMLLVSGSQIPIEGAQPYSVVRSAIEASLSPAN
jgi:protein-disulfide isomerase